MPCSQWAIPAEASVSQWAVNPEAVSSGWSIAQEATSPSWTVPTELSAPSWSTPAEAVESTAYAVAIPCQFSFDEPHTGVVLTSPNGLVQRRLEVDTDGTVGAGLLTDSTPTGKDVLFSTPSTGPIIQLSDGTYGRIRIDNDGVLVADPVTLPSTGWLVTLDNIGAIGVDVLINVAGSGVICMTPDSLHTYRVRLDLDGAFISEIVS